MTRAPTARLFVAVDPPESVCNALAGWARSALRSARARGGSDGASLRVLGPESLHLTLCFLGSRPVGEIEPIIAQLRACASPVGELSVGAPLWLPPRRPRALAVEVHDDTGELATLHETVLTAVREVSAWETDAPNRAGVRRSRRHFRPHITIARMRGDAVPRDRALPPTPSLSFVPEELVLYRSRLSPEGASYEALESLRID